MAGDWVQSFYTNRSPVDYLGRRLIKQHLSAPTCSPSVLGIVVPYWLILGGKLVWGILAGHCNIIFNDKGKDTLAAETAIPGS